MLDGIVEFGVNDEAFVLFFERAGRSSRAMRLRISEKKTCWFILLGWAVQQRYEILYLWGINSNLDLAI
jgi:hypothetical protein